MHTHKHMYMCGFVCVCGGGGVCIYLIRELPSTAVHRNDEKNKDLKDEFENVFQLKQLWTLLPRYRSQFLIYLFVYLFIFCFKGLIKTRQFE